MNYKQLMAFDIPDIHQEYSVFDTIRYALSVGIGQDQLDPWQLQFANESNGPAVIPSFCTVLGHPGFWLGDPRTSVNATKLVHAAQEIKIENSIPSSGTVIGKTQIKDVVDKGSAKGALLYLEKKLLDKISGNLLATERRTIMLRGDGGYDGPSGVIPSAPPGPSGSTLASITIQTRPEQALLYRLNGDPNPLHIDPDIAKAAGFEKPILHGLCTFGIACQAILQTILNSDLSKFGGMSARFSAPVFPGDTILIESWENGAFQATAIEREKIVLSNGFVTRK